MSKKFTYFFNSRKRYFGGLLGVVLFAAIGAYFVFWADAQVFIPDTGNAYTPVSEANTPRAAGESFNLPFIGNMDVTSSSAQYIVEVSYAGSRVKPQTPIFTCGAAYQCTRVNKYGPDQGRYSSSYLVCLDVPRGSYRNITLFTAHFVTTADLPWGGGWLSYKSGIGAGTCASAGGVAWGAGYGSCGGVNYACDQGPGPGFDEGPAGNGDNDEGPNGTGPGGSGSSAKKQTDQPNTAPSSSSQGEKENPEIEPSPFFDGKEFAPGSDADNLSSTISSTGRKLVRSWLLILLSLGLGGMAGLGYWRWRYKRKLG